MIIPSCAVMLSIWIYFSCHHCSHHGQVLFWAASPVPWFPVPSLFPGCLPTALQMSYVQLGVSHHAWRPVNLYVSDHSQFHLPQVLFTRLMKNLCVPEIITREFLHICQNFRGGCKSNVNDIFWLENNLYLHYSHKGVIVRVKETICKLQN